MSGDERPVVMLPTVVDTWNFTVGQPVVLSTSDGGRTWRKLTGWRLLAYKLKQRARDWTRWWRPRLVVATIDKSEGSISMATERWSWRRWRWERV